MKKRSLLMSCLFILAGNFSFAQNASNSASQTVVLQLNPVIEIAATNSGNVVLGFSNSNNYGSGVQSGNQQFQVRSNKTFTVTVNTDASTFTYSGAHAQAPTMPVANTLFMEVANNNTGGNTAGSFSNFTSLSTAPQTLLTNCSMGNSQTFAVNYKAQPGYGYPSGAYSVGIVYTATQL